MNLTALNDKMWGVGRGLIKKSHFPRMEQMTSLLAVSKNQHYATNAYTKCNNHGLSSVPNWMFRIGG